MNINPLTNKNPLLCIIGPTACGKTKLAVAVAEQLNGEILSADSRQVYRGMTIGTGKDIEDYTINNKSITYHLIDIVDAGYHYNIFEYQQDFYKAYATIMKKEKLPICCGGSGMYIEAILKSYQLDFVPIDENFRKICEKKSTDVLIEELKQLKTLHNTTDISDRQRLIRALEICKYEKSHQIENAKTFNYQIFYINANREDLRKKIKIRLNERFKQGMIEEVQNLINQGINAEQLKYYGLEYKFIAQYLNGESSFDEMKEKLYIAIGQFAKRQQTWFNRMKKQGFNMIDIDMNCSENEKIKQIVSQWKKKII